MIEQNKNNPKNKQQNQKHQAILQPQVRRGIQTVGRIVNRKIVTETDFSGKKAKVIESHGIHDTTTS